MQLTSELSVRDVGGDEGGDGQGGRGGKEKGDLSDSSDVLNSVGGAESEVLKREWTCVSALNSAISSISRSW